MEKPVRNRSWGRWLVGVCLAAALAAGCEPAADTPTGRSPVCPTCTPLAGGQSSDFSGVIAACALFTKSTRIDEAEATALGFDVAGVRELMERPIDSVFYWNPQSTAGGGPAQGYAPVTRVSGRLKVESYVHSRPDPERCDGTKCVDPNAGNQEVSQVGCHDVLYVGASLALQTEDGALAFAMPDAPVLPNTPTGGYTPPYGFKLLLYRDADPASDSGPAAVDLAYATGALRLAPELPGPTKGLLHVSLSFLEAGTKVDLSVEVWSEASTDAGTARPRYRPLEGTTWAPSP